VQGGRELREKGRVSGSMVSIILVSNVNVMKG